MKTVRYAGFTLIECLVALLVAAATSLLLTGVVKNYQGLSQIEVSDPAQWYSMVQVLEGGQYQFELQSVGDTTLKLYSRVENRTYRVKQSNGIYLAKNGEGYQPLYQVVHGVVYFHRENEQTITAYVKQGKRVSHVTQIHFLPATRPLTVNERVDHARRDR